MAPGLTEGVMLDDSVALKRHRRTMSDINVYLDIFCLINLVAGLN